MPTFIDESGDTGNAVGSSPYFRLAAVWVPTLEDVGGFRASVQELRRQLGLNAAFEFKHATTHLYPQRRMGFLKAALAFDFRFAFTSIEKREAYWEGASRKEIQWECVTDLAACMRFIYERHELQHSLPIRELIFVDDNGDQSFFQLVKRQFGAMRSRKFAPRSLVGKVRFRKSDDLAMIQLADMICGVAGDVMDGKSSEAFDLIHDRKVDQCELGPRH